MKLEKLIGERFKEKPADAVIDSHALMVRGGYIKQVAGGIFSSYTIMRRIAGFWDIDLDIDVDPGCTIYQAHSIATKVEKEIKLRLENVFDIMIHIEPRGNTEDEMYGLSENDITNVNDITKMNEKIDENMT